VLERLVAQLTGLLVPKGEEVGEKVHGDSFTAEGAEKCADNPQRLIKLTLGPGQRPRAAGLA
jgi:hypothetical protein